MVTSGHSLDSTMDHQIQVGCNRLLARIKQLKYQFYVVVLHEISQKTRGIISAIDSGSS